MWMIPEVTPHVCHHTYCSNMAKTYVDELLECFQWSDEEFDLQHVKEELADVMVYCQNLLDKLGLDADQIVNMKMSMNEKSIR